MRLERAEQDKLRRDPMQHPSTLTRCAMVAAKMYETYRWLRYSGFRYDDGESAYHVPDVEQVAYDLRELALKALASPDGEASHTRYVATVDRDGLFCQDVSVNVFMSLGWFDANELARLTTLEKP